MHIQLDTIGSKIRLFMEAPPQTIEINFTKAPAASPPTSGPVGVPIDILKRIIAGAHDLSELEFDIARTPRCLRAREVAMYIATELTTLSLPQIAREFGKKDHAAVMHARDKVKDEMRSNDAYREDVRNLIGQCQKVVVS